MGSAELECIHFVHFNIPDERVGGTYLFLFADCTMYALDSGYLFVCSRQSFDKWRSLSEQASSNPFDHKYLFTKNLPAMQKCLR